MKKIVPTIVIIPGDPAGIGPEVVAKTLNDPKMPKGFRFEIRWAGGKGITPGKPNRSSAQAALDALTEAAQGCLSGKYSAMVTGPVHKETIARLQPDFVGQTEFLARACGLDDDAAVMVLTDPKLIVALCTTHCSLKNAIKRLSAKRIVYVARVMNEFLKHSGCTNPRMAFAAVNPHMGESGLFGDEDSRIVQPALMKLKKENIPVVHAPADTVFYYAVQNKAYDAVLCAYHDQGLIPFKMVAFQTGVNVTLGLPIIRTSPDHGTAVEIAGKGVADHRSMLAAVKLACRLATKRATLYNE